MNNAALTAIRDIATRSSYPFTLAFTREFTSGTLVGLTHDDTIGFCTALDAEEWISSINSANRKGKLNYRVSRRWLELGGRLNGWRIEDSRGHRVEAEFSDGVQP